MKKKIIVLTLIGCIIFSIVGCQNIDSVQTETADPSQTQTNEIATETTQDASAVQATEIQETAAQTTTTQETEEQTTTTQTTAISDEIATVEAAYQEILSRDASEYTQGDMNAECYEEYKLWDDELNNLWRQIESTLDESAYASILDEQSKWLERKKLHVRACGSMAAGGSMQPMLESSGASEMTRVRCYQLAKVLADAVGEQFSTEKIEAVVDYVDPSYDDVMWGFRGPHELVSYDDSTGELMISHESDEWEAIITYNGVKQQVELWGYNSDRIIWKSSEGEFFEIGLSWEDELEFTHRNDLNNYFEVIS